MISSLHQLKSNFCSVKWVLVLVFLLIIQQEELNSLSSEQSCKNQNLSYQGNFRWILDQGKGNLVRVSRELELSEFVLTK